jgi:CcmD family protein
MMPSTGYLVAAYVIAGLSLALYAVYLRRRQATVAREIAAFAADDGLCPTNDEGRMTQGIGPPSFVLRRDRPLHDDLIDAPDAGAVDHRRAER